MPDPAGIDEPSCANPPRGFRSRIEIVLAVPFATARSGRAVLVEVGGDDVVGIGVDGERGAELLGEARLRRCGVGEERERRE